jgi:hypothetical protein
MTASSASYAEATGSPPGARLSRANAFRVLSLPADAELKEIRSQQQRLLVRDEIGKQEGTGVYGLPPLRNLSKEEILEAVHVLEGAEEGLIEELFWLHEMDGLRDARLNDVLASLHHTAAGNTTHSAVARHNLAVMHSICGQELAGNHWEEALNRWKNVIDDDLFWTFMSDRALRIGCKKSDCGMMKAAVRRQLSATFSQEMVRAVKSRELAAVPVLARIAMEHRSWLELGAALNFVGQQEIKDGFVSLGAILDRLSGITQQDTKANIRSSLEGREKDLRDVVEKYGDVVRSLGELADPDGWDNAVASSYQRFSAAYFTLGDSDHAIRLIVQARELARDPQLLQSMERDRQNIQRVILRREADQQQLQRANLCREADASIKSGNFDWAEHLLETVFVISTEEQKLEIKAMLERCRTGRVLRGVDRDKNNPIISSLPGFGPRFYGERDYDAATGSYVANHWLTFLFVPIFPLGAYRVTDADSGSYCILGRVPLPGSLKKARWAIAISVIVLILAFVFMATNRGRASSQIVGPSPGPAGPKAAPTSGPALTQQPANEIEEKTPSEVAQSLQDTKRKLDVEGANLEKEKGYLAKVKAAYQGERVPDGGQAIYEGLFADYNSRMDKYNRKLSEWERDFAANADRKNPIQPTGGGTQ